jgi:hypothetical protein
LIVVKDVGCSRKLYEGILGQKVTADYGENIVFDGFSIHQREHYRSLIGNREITANSNAFELYFEENDLEALEKVIIDEAFEIIHGVREQPWRQKVLRFYDDGTSSKSAKASIIWSSGFMRRICLSKKYPQSHI